MSVGEKREKRNGIDGVEGGITINWLTNFIHFPLFYDNSIKMSKLSDNLKQYPQIDTQYKEFCATCTMNFSVITG